MTYEQQQGRSSSHERTWEDHVEQMTFKTAQLSPMNEWFRRIAQDMTPQAQEIRNYAEQIYEKAHEVYSEEDAHRIFKGYMLGVTLHQLNDTPNRRYRKNEFVEGAPETDEYKLPYSVHFSRMLLKAMDIESHPRIGEKDKKVQGVSVDLAIATCLHDLYEDCAMTLDGTLYEGRKWKSVIEAEFNEPESDNPHYHNLGEQITDIIECVSKREIPYHESIIDSSPLYNTIHNLIYITQRFKNPMTMEPVNMEPFKQDIVKSLSALMHIIEFPLLKYGSDDDKVVELTMKALTLKCLDGHDNMLSPGSSTATLLRNRLMTHMARIGLMDISNDLKQALALSGDDPIFLGTDRDLAVQMTDEKKQALTAEAYRVFGAYEPEITVGWRITMPDEVYALQEDPMNFRSFPQTMVRMSHEKYGQFMNDGNAWLRNLRGPYTKGASVISGVMHDLINYSGRPGMMYVTFDNHELLPGQITAVSDGYVRIIVDEPQLSDLVIRGSPVEQRDIPEALFFRAGAHEAEDQQAILNRLALFFNINILGNSHHIVVSDRIEIRNGAHPADAGQGDPTKQDPILSPLRTNGYPYIYFTTHPQVV